MKKNLCIRYNLFFFLLLLNHVIHAQVPVYEEPRHKVVLLNDYVRLIDVHVPPNDTTLYHRHFTPSAIVFLTKNLTGSQPMGGTASTGQAIPGNTFFAGYGDKPIAHRVWNQDSTVYHVMDIELLNKTFADSCEIIQNPSVQLSWNEKPARMYRIHLNAGTLYSLLPGNCPHLLIMISGSAEIISGKTTKQMKGGDFVWCDHENGFHISNVVSPSDFALLELKK
jgi:hypothetical protein